MADATDEPKPTTLPKERQLTNRTDLICFLALCRIRTCQAQQFHPKSVPCHSPSRARHIAGALLTGSPARR